MRSSPRKARPAGAQHHKGRRELPRRHVSRMRFSLIACRSVRRTADAYARSKQSSFRADISITSSRRSHRVGKAQNVRLHLQVLIHLFHPMLYVVALIDLVIHGAEPEDSFTSPRGRCRHGVLLKTDSVVERKGDASSNDISARLR